VAYGLAVISGLVYFLGLPGVNVWPVAFVTMAPLLVALRGRGPRDAAALGLVSGFVASMLGFSWLFGTFQRFAGFPVPVCALLVVVMCAYQAGRTGVTCWLTARAAERGWPASIAFVLAWTTGELLYPLLFPWYLAFMVHSAPILLQTADLGGVYLVGALLLGPNLAIAEAVGARLARTRVDRRVVAGGLLAPILGAAYGAFRIPRVEAAAAQGMSVTVGIAQGNLPLLTRKGGVEIHRRLTEKLRDEGAHLVVWSEGSVPGLVDGQKGARRIVSGLRVPVLFGADVRLASGGHPRNSAFLSDIDGSIVGRYDKQYLLPFGEFIPFGETFPRLYRWSPNSGRLAPGTSLAPLVLAGHPITALICYEDVLPWFVSRAVAEARPELLVNVAIDTWFGDGIEPWEHLALAQIRSVEHRRYLVRAANSGVSAIVDPVGRLTVHGGLFTEESLLGEVHLSAPTTPYEMLSDLPWYAAALAIAAMASIRRRSTP
jgi:apolipoprotein N-acyltransferase